MGILLLERCLLGMIILGSRLGTTVMSTPNLLLLETIEGLLHLVTIENTDLLLVVLVLVNMMTIEEARLLQLTGIVILRRNLLSSEAVTLLLTLLIVAILRHLRRQTTMTEDLMTGLLGHTHLTIGLDLLLDKNTNDHLGQ